MVFPDGSMVKNLPAMQETQVQSLGQEDPLEEGMTTHSSILAWETHRQKILVGYSPWGQKHDLATKHHHQHPTCHRATGPSHNNYKVRAPQRKITHDATKILHAATKILRAATKTRGIQIHK